jgi:hypothetical protein
MSSALAEPGVTTPTDANANTNTNACTARAEASRANGRLSRGPTSPEGKARSRCNGCKDGLTGAGIVLPPAAAAEVERREAEFVRDLRPRNAVERELVRQMALGAWRRHELGMRIFQHDERMNAARFANWEQDEQIAAAELGRRLADDPEAVVARLQRTSAGCDWLIGRWTLLGNALSSADEGGPGCTWTDADLALALNLLGRPTELRHLDDWSGRLESLRAEAQSGSDEAVTELRQIVTDEVARLQRRDEEVWEAVEKPQVQGWCSGVEIDLGPEGTRLRRYEAAADRLFRSAWTKLERLREASGRPMIHRSAPLPVPEPATTPLPAAAPAPAAVPSRPLPAVSRSSRLSEPAATFLDIWAAGQPRPGNNLGSFSQNKTNPAPSRPAKAGGAALLENIL